MKGRWKFVIASQSSSRGTLIVEPSSNGNVKIRTAVNDHPNYAWVNTEDLIKLGRVLESLRGVESSLEGD